MEIDVPLKKVTKKFPEATIKVDDPQDTYSKYECWFVDSISGDEFNVYARHRITTIGVTRNVSDDAVTKFATWLSQVV